MSRLGRRLQQASSNITPVVVPSSWPDATNTGYRNASGYTGSLADGSVLTIVSNQVYNHYAFDGGLAVGSSSNSLVNVTFNGCRFYGIAVENALVTLYGDNITFNYCSFEPGVAAPPVAYDKSYQYGLAGNGGYHTAIQQLTVSHCDIWGFGNAIDCKGSTQAKPHLFEHNWIHDAANDGGSYHTDGIGDESGSGLGSYVTIHHNTIMSVGNTNGIAYQQGTYDHFTVTDNLLGGFGYTVAIWANTSTTFTGNTFDASTIPAVWGPLYSQTFWTGGTSLWRNNTWKSVDANNGKFWTPSGSSVTDYTG